MSGQFLGRLLLAVSRGCSTATCSDSSFPTHRLPSPLSPSLQDGYHLVKGPLLWMEVATLTLVVKAQPLSIQEFLSGTHRDLKPPWIAGCPGSAQAALYCLQAQELRICLRTPPAYNPKQGAQKGGRWWEGQ